MLLYMLAFLMLTTDQPWTEMVSFQTQLSSDALHALGVKSTADKLVFCINLLAGSLGALALLSADLGRYARSSADIGAAVVLGGSTLGIFMVSLGGILMYAGMPILVEHYVSVRGVPEQQAIQLAVQDPDHVAAAFIVIGGTIGGILVVAAQAKAQVINTYSSSLSLSNLFDAIFSWQPGRFLFVVLANMLSLLLLYGDLLSWFHSFLKVLGILTTSFAGVVLADYFIVGRLAQRWQLALQTGEMINWAGIVTIPTAFILAHIFLNRIVRVEIFTGLAVAFVLYPVLRLSTLRPMRCSKDTWSA
jgi:cytosine permease